MRDRLALWIPLAAALGIFAVLARDGLRMGFTYDDMMNLHGYWTRPWRELLVALAAWWSDSYRPLGGLFYRGLFDVFGFNPLPFHAVNLGLVAVNIGLGAWLAFELTGGSHQAAGLAAVLGSFNAGLVDLYVSSACIYDVLCFSAYAAGLAWYARLRRGGRHPRWIEIGGVLVLFVAALDAKEMGATLPVAIAIYEALFHGPKADPRAALASAAMLVPYVWGKLSAGSKLAGNAEYAMHPGFAQYARAVDHYVTIALNVGYESVAPWMIAAVAAAALILGNRAVRFGVLLTAVAILPVAFISLRSGFAFYVPMLGLIVAGAAALAAIPAPWWLVAPVAAVGVVWQQRVPLKEYDNQRVIRDMAVQWKSTFPVIPKGTSILITDDPFAADEWTPLFVARLLYKDPEMVVNRIKLGFPNKPEDYTWVIDFVDGRYVLRK